MAGRASVVVFDVNEASSDMGPLRGRLEEVGAPGHPRDTWFAGTLRDGCALTAAGEYAEFAAVAKAALRVVLSRVHGLRRELDDAASYVLAGFPELEGHPDVPDGMRMLHQAGVRLVTLTNGSADLAAGTFARAGVLDLLERRMSVGEPRCWKPTPAAYHFAARVCGVPIEQMALEAVHPPVGQRRGDPRGDDHRVDRSNRFAVPGLPPPGGRVGARPAGCRGRAAVAVSVFARFRITVTVVCQISSPCGQQVYWWPETR